MTLDGYWLCFCVVYCVGSYGEYDLEVLPLQKIVSTIVTSFNDQARLET